MTLRAGKRQPIVVRWTRGFHDEPFGAVEVWARGVRYRLTACRWNPRERQLWDR